MPQRFLKPGITTSDNWNACSFEAQSLYIRILTLVDDFGRCDGRLPILHGQCFALRPDIKPQRTAALRWELSENKLVLIYTVDGKEFIQLLRWSERARSEKSKFPDPPQDSAADGSGPQEKVASLVPRSSPLHPRSSPSAPADLERVRRLFRKKEGTKMDNSETKAWNAARSTIGTTTPEDWALLEWAYAQNQGDAQRWRRRDMATLLNNWNAEIDRARGWKRNPNGSEPQRFQKQVDPNQQRRDEEYERAQEKYGSRG